MKAKSLGFIGGGRITKIFLQAFHNKNAKFSQVVITDTNNEVTEKLKKKFPYIQIEKPSVAASQDIVFISLHPPVIMDTLELLKNDFRSSATVISLAPKITLTKVSSKLGQVNNLVRLIPNATSYINEGYNPVCFSAGFANNEKKEIFDLLGLLGKTFEVPEEKLESYAIMSAMLPTYFWFQWKELAEIGQKIGLSEKESKDSIHETLNASLNIMYKSGMNPEEVIDLIPVKPISEHETQITEFYNSKLIGLFEKIRP
jgi:pyrroline-5-carboxylate reductase